MTTEMEAKRGERIVTSTCAGDCGGRCPLKVYVQDGKVMKITTDDRFGPDLQACARGLIQRDVLYAPDRITVPLKRTGPRGSGKFAPISWDEALDNVSAALKDAKEKDGPQSVFLMDYSGSVSLLHGTQKASRRFFSFFGGCSSWRGNSSMEGAAFSSKATFGTIFTGNSRDNFLSSRLIILWGWNPLDTRFGPETAGYLMKAKERGAKIISVDPRSSNSAEKLADQWIAVKPGTDSALMIAMAYVLIAEDLYDRTFIETYTSGFAQFKEYVTGAADSIPKTPAWAEEITGVPRESIERLARDYATQKPAALCAGWAPGRSAFGEQYHRAAATLAAMTGNIGVQGGHASGGTDVKMEGFLWGSLEVPGGKNPAVHITDIYNLLLKGKAGGYPSDIRVLYIVGSNMLNQFLNLNKGIRALQAPAFTVIHELFMTPTARYADIVLPVAHFLEREDIGQPFAGGTYDIVMEKAVEAQGDARTDLAIFTKLAFRLGLAGFNDKTDGEWLKEFVSQTPGLPPYDVLRDIKVHRAEPAGPLVAFRKQIKDPANNPFPTPSGKIEIFSQKIAAMKNPLIPPIPQFIDAWDGPRDPLARKYPLQLVSPHSKFRVNSTLDNIPRLKKNADDAAWLNPQDAQARAIGNGDRVRIYNDRGQVVVRAKVTARIMRGVTSLDAGAWYKPDDTGVDHGGCVNVLTRDEKTPAGAFPSNTCLVQIEKYDGA